MHHLKYDLKNKAHVIILDKKRTSTKLSLKNDILKHEQKKNQSGRIMLRKYC